MSVAGSSVSVNMFPASGGGDIVVNVAGPARERRPATSLDRNRNKCAGRQSRKARKLRTLRGREQKAILASCDVLGFDLPGDSVDWLAMGGRIRQCGRLGVWGCSECGGEVGRKVFHCKQRLCPGCAARRAELVARKVVPLLEVMSKPAHIVLTVRNRLVLGDADRHLRESFKRLRRHVGFQRAFRGGLVFEETSHSAEGWHAHLHIIADGRMPQEELSAAWQEVTGDSRVVWISAIKGKDRAKVLNEAVKYPCKLSDIVCEPGLVYEWVHYFHGRRIMWTWGSMYNVGVDATDEEMEEDLFEEEEKLGTCPLCGSWHSFHRLPRRSFWQFSAVALKGGWWIVVDDKGVADHVSNNGSVSEGS